MSKKALFPQSRRHILVYDEDWEYLGKVFGPGAEAPMGQGEVIRQITHLYVKRMKDREQQATERNLSSAGASNEQS